MKYLIAVKMGGEMEIFEFDKRENRFAFIYDLWLTDCMGTPVEWATSEIE